MARTKREIRGRKVKRYQKGKKTKFRDTTEDFKHDDYTRANIVNVPRKGPGKKKFFQTKKGYAKKYAAHMPEYTRRYDHETKTYTDEKTGPQQLTFQRGRKTVTYDVSPTGIKEKRIRIGTPKTVLPRTGTSTRKREHAKGKLRTWVRSKRERDVSKEGGLWSTKGDTPGKGNIYDTATRSQIGQDGYYVRDRGPDKDTEVRPKRRQKGKHKNPSLRETNVFRGDLKSRKQKQAFDYQYQPGKYDVVNPARDYTDQIVPYYDKEYVDKVHGYKEDPKSRFNSGGRVRGFREGGALDQHD